MTGRTLIRDLIAGKKVPRCGFWAGSPDPRTVELYLTRTGLPDKEALQRMLGDDVVWITPQYIRSTYRHPEGRSMRPWKEQNPHGMAGGPLSGCTTVEQVAAYPWPDVSYLDFTESLATLRGAGDRYRLSGFWSPFFHDLTYLLGTEELLMAMFLHPEVVHAILERLCGFYLKANELFYAAAGGEMDALFFGNDFGTQNDLLFGPEQFEEFFLPWIRRFATQAHGAGYRCVMHCCGSVYRIIDTLAEAGVDCLHPIQAQAYNMNADYLAAHFKGKIAFMGGVDMQEILPHGTPEQVAAEVRRVASLLGPNLVIGPSHEALLPDIPFENVQAMATEAHNIRFTHGD